MNTEVNTLLHHLHTTAGTDDAKFDQNTHIDGEERLRELNGDVDEGDGIDGDGDEGDGIDGDGDEGDGIDGDVDEGDGIDGDGDEGDGIDGDGDEGDGIDGDGDEGEAVGEGYRDGFEGHSKKRKVAGKLAPNVDIKLGGSGMEDPGGPRFFVR